MPVLLKLMNEEEQIKMKTQAASCMVGFVRGLVKENEDEEMASSLTPTQKNSLLLPYQD